MTWPNDADGDVLRRMEGNGFDFSKEYDVDFSIDFENWPPSDEAIKIIKFKYPNMQVIESSENDTEDGKLSGYVIFQIRSKVNYEFVTSIQNRVTEMMQEFGGWCESWGVLH